MFKVRRRILSALAALLVAPALMGAGVAHADEDSFLTDMEKAGFQNDGGNAAELKVGWDECRIASTGGRAAAVKDLWHNANMDEDSAIRFVDIAIRDLCPQ
jgi:hypothetical protein